MTGQLDPIYPVTAASPPLRVKVRVYWRGRIFVAARTTHPKTKRPCWVTPNAVHELTYLPPKHDERLRYRWGSDPDWWQPLEPAAWKHPLPPAKPTVTEVQAQAVITQDEREAVANFKRRWWRDEPYLIRYDEPAGEVSRTMVEARMMRALAIGRVYAKASVRRQIAGAFPELASIDHPQGAGWATAAAAETGMLVDETVHSDGAQPLEPLPSDIGDWTVAMGWFAAINPPEVWHPSRQPFTLNREQRVLVWRALDNPLTWRQIGVRLGGLNWRTAFDIYTLAITRCARVANGKSAFPRRTIRNQIVELQRRNRAHKRVA